MVTVGDGPMRGDVMTAVSSVSAPARACAWKRRTEWIAGLGLAIVFVAVLMLTATTFVGDTHFYVGDIVRARTGRQPFTSLLDFGHLIWRPLGYLLSQGQPGSG